jgi:hypothetical protein
VPLDTPDPIALKKYYALEKPSFFFMTNITKDDPEM